MPPRFATILDRLRQDLADCLAPDAIRDACLAAGHAWRTGVLDPIATVYLVLLQVLHGNTACQHVAHFGLRAFTASAFCQARKRLPLGVWEHLLGRTAEAARRATAAASRWRGHRVWIADGSSFSMPDTDELRGHFGQPGCQRQGCGFPVARLLVLLDMATGLLARAVAAPLNSHEMAGVAEVHGELDRGDVLLADRAFGSFAHLAALASRGLHAVVRVHQVQIVDFTPGRAHVPPEAKRSPRLVGLPRSRWLRALGAADQVVAWSKAAVAKPRWMGADDFAALPAELAVRELRYRVEAPGFRTRSVTLASTLVDAEAYPAEALAELYFRRWRVETALGHLKTTMKMDVLKCKTVDGIAKELAAFALAYDLVCAVRAESTRSSGVDPSRVSFVDALRWLVEPRRGEVGTELVVNPLRPGRVEPRVRKRRPKQYPVMKLPRAVLRKRLMEQSVPA